jgi:hypothetical protein
MLPRTIRIGAPLVALGLLLWASCKKAPPGGGGDGSDAGPPPSGRCEIDLDLSASGRGAAARLIATPDDLIGGEAATGQLGDFLLVNDKVRVIIEKVDRHVAPLPFGGTIVDADVVRGPGLAGQDSFGEMGPFYQLGRTVEATQVEVLRDGSDGGPAVVAATGRDALDDYFNVNSVIASFTGGAITLALDTEAEVPLLATTYYVLSPGERRVELVTALCNQGEKPLLLPVGDLLDTGGDVAVFNPFAKAGGFGVSYSEIADTPDFALVGSEVAYAYLPPTVQNQSLFVAGVVGTLLGSSGVTDWLSVEGRKTGALKIPGRGAASYRRSLVIARSLSELRDEVLTARGGPLRRLSGTVTRGGAPVVGAKVAAVRPVTYRYSTADGTERAESRTVTESVFTTGPDGAYGGLLPPGDYSVWSVAPDARPTPEAALSLGAADVRKDLALDAPAVVTVSVRDAGKGLPMPAKVAFLCPGSCPERNRLFRIGEPQIQGLPPDVARIVYSDARGEVTLRLPAGDYDVLVSRGPEWSTWPDGYPAQRGERVSLVAGANPPLRATLNHVVDTTGWMSGDFHVHGINSPDSPVPHVARVQSFLGEGVDILVSTDHDFVTDYAPTIARLDALSAPGAPKASDLLATFTGVELTTFDYGHFNSFPITAKPEDRNGGALDWANGTGPSLTPKELMAGLKALPGPAGAPRVVQLNHPRGGSHLNRIKVDTRTFISHEDPARYRLPPRAPDARGDTGLFDRGFTAIELLNNFNQDDVHAVMNDWFTFMARGFLVTGTAVSDTHSRLSFSGGYGRSYCRVGVDRPQDLTPSALALAVNSRRVVGTLGPFVTLEAVNASGQKAQVGETLATSGKAITLSVTVQAPTWMTWDRIEVHTYRPGTEASNGESNFSWPKDGADGLPTLLKDAGLAVAVDLAAEPRVKGADGGLGTVVRRVFTATPAADTFYVAMVRRPKSTAPLAPLVVPNKPVGLLAFTNAVLVDVDGGGYDKFPMDVSPPASEREGEKPEVRREPLPKSLKAVLEGALRETNHGLAAGEE